MDYICFVMLERLKNKICGLEHAAAEFGVNLVEESRSKSSKRKLISE